MNSPFKQIFRKEGQISFHYQNVLPDFLPLTTKTKTGKNSGVTCQQNRSQQMFLWRHPRMFNLMASIIYIFTDPNELN